MRIFYWNPKTGRYGEEIEQRPLASWTDQSLEHATREGLVAPIVYAAPAGFSAKSNVTVHLDAGRTTADGDGSYRHATEWCCFCLGEWNAGEDSAWEWVILPPANLVRRLGVLA